MKKTLAILAMLSGFSVPLHAQSASPVEVACVKGADTYKAICSQLKKAVKKSPLFKPSKNGNRYAVVIFAQTGNIAGGDVNMSIAYVAVLSDPLSQIFPYNIVTVPVVFSPSQSAALATGIIDGGLVAAVIIFESVVDEINSYGASAMRIDEATMQEMQKRVTSEIGRVRSEQTQ